MQSTCLEWWICFYLVWSALASSVCDKLQWFIGYIVYVDTISFRKLYNRITGNHESRTQALGHVHLQEQSHMHGKCTWWIDTSVNNVCISCILTSSSSPVTYDCALSCIASMPSLISGTYPGWLWKLIGRLHSAFESNTNVVNGLGGLIHYRNGCRSLWGAQVVSVH